MIFPFDSNRLRSVAAFATKAHEGQERMPGVPYIVHPFSVMASIMNHPDDFGADLEVAALTGLLHDVLEDNHRIVIRDIMEVTGSERVCKGVLALTKDKSIAGKAAQIIDSVRRCLLAGPWVVGVKGIDRAENWNAATMPPHWQPSWNIDYVYEGDPILNAVIECKLFSIRTTMLTARGQYLAAAEARLKD